MDNGECGNEKRSEASKRTRTREGGRREKQEEEDGKERERERSTATIKQTSNKGKIEDVEEEGEV